MIREEAIETLKENFCAMCAYGSQSMMSCDIRGCDNRDAINALEQEPRWIPVNEKLPEYGTAVLTIDTEDTYKINRIIDDEYGEWLYGGVIAWMPLPEPYKAESEDKNEKENQIL